MRVLVIFPILSPESDIVVDMSESLGDIIDKSGCSTSGSRCLLMMAPFFGSAVLITLLETILWVSGQ